MDKVKTNIPINDNSLSIPLSADDMSTLQHVLKTVRGSYPAEPYRQADFDFAEQE